MALEVRMDVQSQIVAERAMANRARLAAELEIHGVIEDRLVAPALLGLSNPNELPPETVCRGLLQLFHSLPLAIPLSVILWWAILRLVGML